MQVERDGETLDISIFALAKSAELHEPVVFAEFLDAYCNDYRKGYSHGREVGEALQTHHRTLQHIVVDEIAGILAGLAEQEHTDPRNERAIEVARQMVEVYEEKGSGMLI